MQTAAEIQTHLLMKISDDAEFRERLAQDPKAVIEEETGEELPDNALVFIRQTIADARAQEEAPETIPPLTREELAQVVGGVDCENDLNTNWYAECWD